MLIASVVWYALLATGLDASLGFDPIHWLDVPISLVALAGVLNYAYRRLLAGPWFWRAWLALTVIWDLLRFFGWFGALWGPRMDELSPTWILVGAALYFATLPLVLPAYIALFLYARDWDQAERRDQTAPNPTEDRHRTGSEPGSGERGERLPRAVT